MDDASLDLGLREDCVDGIPKTGKTINRYDHDIFDTSVLDLVQYAQPVFGTLISSDPHPEYFPAPVQFRAYGNVYSLFYSTIILPYMEVDSVHEYVRVFTLQRTILPFPGEREYPVRHM